jgi:nondiscriminating glutamyl-tRNA synthetase
MDNPNIRVRFAPSPTGLLHVGNARTALYNWLFARRSGGQFVLRIEDTDADRSEARYETQLMEDLRWLGLDWDEGPGEAAEKGVKPKDKGANGPYRQSDRQHVYAKLTQKLLEDGKAYRCFCTVSELEEERRLAAAHHQPQVYSGRCRKLTPRAVKKNLEAGKPYAVRLKTGEQSLRFHDVVRGTVQFSAEEVNDLILVRSGHDNAPGAPVYNYVVAIDDAAMGITHIIRGEDHLANAPKQVAIYQAFGWKVPEFAHLSAILGTDRERLSKRHGATTIASFREMGYLPEALVNYLALVGWSPADGKSEAFTLQGLLKVFTLDRIAAEPSIFDFARLDALNRHFMKAVSPARLARLAWEYFGFLLPSKEDASDDVLVWFAGLVQLFAASVDHLDQLPAKTLFMWGFNPHEVRAKADNAEALAADSARSVLAHFADRVRNNYMPITGELLKDWLNEIRDTTGVKGKDLTHPIRIALTGTQTGPEFDRLIPLIEQGSMLGIGVPSIRQRIEQFVG